MALPLSFDGTRHLPVQSNGDTTQLPSPSAPTNTHAAHGQRPHRNTSHEPRNNYQDRNRILIRRLKGFAKKLNPNIEVEARTPWGNGPQRRRGAIRHEDVVGTTLDILEDFSQQSEIMGNILTILGQKEIAEAFRLCFQKSGSRNHTVSYSKLVSLHNSMQKMQHTYFP